jgi:hypothetical protein
LYDREVEIIIVPKAEERTQRTTKATEFVKKWAGFLKNSERLFQ